MKILIDLVRNSILVGTFMHLQGGAVYVPQYLVDYGSGSTLGQKNNTVGINCLN